MQDYINSLAKDLGIRAGQGIDLSMLNDTLDLEVEVVHCSNEHHRLSIDDCGGVCPNDTIPLDVTAQALLQLDMLRDDVVRHPEIRNDQLTAYVKSQFSSMVERLHIALQKHPVDIGTDGNPVRWDNAQRLSERGYGVSYDKRNNHLIIEVAHRAFIL